MTNDQGRTLALDRLTRALMGRDPAALSPLERADVDMALLLLEARAEAEKAAAHLEEACARAGGDAGRQLRASTAEVRVILAALELRVARHPAAAAALASLPIGLEPREGLRLVADARAVWRATAARRGGGTGPRN